MSTVAILAGSVEYLRWPIAPTDETGASVSPTADTVELAVRPVRDTTALVWHGSAEGIEWITDASTTPPTYAVRALIGTAPFVLAAGLYRVYVRITDTPEVPALDLGTLYVAAA